MNIRTIIAIAIAYLPLIILFVATGDTIDWKGMWLYYFAVAAVPVLASLDK